MDICLEGIRQETGNKPEKHRSNIGEAGGLQQARENDKKGGREDQEPFRNEIHRMLSV